MKYFSFISFIGLIGIFIGYYENDLNLIVASGFGFIGFLIMSLSMVFAEILDKHNNKK